MDSTAAVLNVTYACGDLVLLAGAARVALRGAVAAVRPPMAWLLAGLGCFVLADVAFAYLSTLSSFTGGQWLDLPWVSAIVLFGVAADVQRRTATTTAAAAESGSAMDARADADGVLQPSRLPYAALAAACTVLLLAAAALPLHPYGGLLLGAVLAVLAASARQLLAVHEHSRLVARLEQAAVTDPLTGVLTRGRFFQLAELELARAARAGTSTGLLMIDVDHFKSVNDRHGHLAGDALLRQIAEHLRSQLRSADLLGRYGGDEFVALLPDADSTGTAAVAQRLLLPVPAPRAHNAPRVHADVGAAAPLPAASVSIGHAAQTAAHDLVGLLGRADAALYAVKLRGRGTAAGFDRLALADVTSPPAPSAHRPAPAAAAAPASIGQRRPATPE